MEEINNYLIYPIDNFWVSYPYCSYGQRIALGIIGGNDSNTQVKSPGIGKVIDITKKSKGYRVTLLYRIGLNYIKLTISPITVMLVEDGDNIKQGQIIGKVREPHLNMVTHVGKKVSDLKIANPMNILYLHPLQIARDNIPYHTPRPLPRRFIGK